MYHPYVNPMYCRYQPSLLSWGKTLCFWLTLIWKNISTTNMAPTKEGTGTITPALPEFKRMSPPGMFWNCGFIPPLENQYWTRWEQINTIRHACWRVAQRQASFNSSRARDPSNGAVSEPVAGCFRFDFARVTTFQKIAVFKNCKEESSSRRSRNKIIGSS